MEGRGQGVQGPGRGEWERRRADAGGRLIAQEGWRAGTKVMLLCKLGSALHIREPLPGDFLPSYPFIPPVLRSFGRAGRPVTALRGTGPTLVLTMLRI